MHQHPTLLHHLATTRQDDLRGDAARWSRPRRRRRRRRPTEAPPLAAALLRPARA